MTLTPSLNTGLENANTYIGNRYVKIGRIVIVSFTYIPSRNYDGFEHITGFSFPRPCFAYPGFAAMVPTNGRILHAFLANESAIIFAENVEAGKMITISGAYISLE